MATLVRQALRDEVLRRRPEELSSNWDDSVFDHLMMASALNDLSVLCWQMADDDVAQARKAGATWGDVAAVTGLSYSGTAARKHDRRQREKHAAAAKHGKEHRRSKTAKD